MFGSSSGNRGDLVGLNRTTGMWHGVEAKGHGPRLSTGNYRGVTKADYDGAKQQAKTLAVDLIARGYPTANDHWAVTSRAATTAILDVVVEDPTVGDDDDGRNEPPPDSDRAFKWDDPEERVLQAYYQVVGDIEKYGAQRGFFVPSPAAAIVEARGIRLAGSRYWIGAATALFEARAKGKLLELLKTGDALPGEDIITDTTIIGGNGLIFARLK